MKTGRRLRWPFVSPMKACGVGGLREELELQNQLGDMAECALNESTMDSAQLAVDFSVTSDLYGNGVFRGEFVAVDVERYGE